LLIWRRSSSRSSDRSMTTTPVSVVPQRKEPPGRDRFLPPADFRKLLDECRAEPELCAFLWLAATTGARKGNDPAAQMWKMCVWRTRHRKPANREKAGPWPVADSGAARMARAVREHLPPRSLFYALAILTGLGDHAPVPASQRIRPQSRIPSLFAPAMSSPAANLPARRVP
jgi:hypothetical protein